MKERERGRERKREGERQEERERVKDRQGESEKEGGRERERCRICSELIFLFLKGTTCALAPFSYLLNYNYLLSP